MLLLKAMSKPVSAKRLAANRANAVRSTGPRTPEGKARSAQNSRKHGFTAANFAVVRLEELDAVANLKADLVAAYQPVNSQELLAVERLALCQQALFRCARMEAGLFTACLNEALDPDGRPLRLMTADLVDGIDVTRAQNRNFALFEGFSRLNAKSNDVPLFLRYQAQTERLYRRAVEEFERLRSLRNVLPNEPIVEPEPEENTPITHPETNPPDALKKPFSVPSKSTSIPTQPQQAKDPRSPKSPRNETPIISPGKTS